MIFFASVKIISHVSIYSYIGVYFQELSRNHMWSATEEGEKKAQEMAENSSRILSRNRPVFEYFGDSPVRR